MQSTSVETLGRTTAPCVAIAATALVLLLLAAAPAQAQVPPTLECGRVTAYTVPTATTPGSIRLGTSTFVLAAGSLPNLPPPIVVGAIICLNGEQNAAGEFLATPVLVGDTWCGAVTGFTPASATTRGSLTLQGNRSRTVAIRSGVSLTGAQFGASQCFKFAFEAEGNPEIVGFVGAVPGAPTPAQAPAVPRLPSTSTEFSGAGLWLGLIGVAIALALLALGRRRFGDRCAAP